MRIPFRRKRKPLPEFPVELSSLKIDGSMRDTDGPVAGAAADPGFLLDKAIQLEEQVSEQRMADQLGLKQLPD